MTADKLRELSADELVKKLKDSQEELFNLRFQQVTNQLNNPQRIPEVRKVIARVKTIMKEEELKEGIKAAAQPKPAVSEKRRAARKAAV